MKTLYNKSSRPLIPGYHENSAIQLILASGVFFILYHVTRIILLILLDDKELVFKSLGENAGLSTLSVARSKVWVIFVYGWVHQGFFDWATNMIWLYCFGAVLQKVSGFKQVIPLFVYGLIIGGLFFLGIQGIMPKISPEENQYFMGAQSGIMALGIAAFTIAPRHRLHFSMSFSIPFIWVIGVYVFLHILLYVPGELSILSLITGGGITGLGYALLLKNGFHPGAWVYHLWNKGQSFFSPNDELIKIKKLENRMKVMRRMYEPKQGITQQQIDEILDKINEKGYASLSKEEKDILLSVGKNN